MNFTAQTKNRTKPGDTMKSALLLLIPLFLLSACGGGDKKTVSTTITVVHGDPILIAKSTYTNTDLPTVNDLKRLLSNSVHVSHNFYVDRSEHNINTNNSSLNAFNSTSKSKSDEEDTISHTEEFTFEIDRKNSIAKFRISENYNEYLYFDINNLDKLSFAGSGTKAGIYENTDLDKIIHFSIDKNTNAFSILRYYSYHSEKENRVVKRLANHRFVTSGPKYFQNHNDHSNKFISGNGAKWPNKKIDILGCGLDTATDNNFIQATKDWNEIGSITINYKKTDSYPPFSDLNTNCAYKINTYISAPDNEANMGFASLTMNSDTIIDGDIFILDEEIKKLDTDHRIKINGESFIANMNQITVTHELGHLLGLGHHFVKNEYASIMNYGITKYKGLTHYDSNTLKELYEGTQISAE